VTNFLRVSPLTIHVFQKIPYMQARVELVQIYLATQIT
jgi:hypothetical protein